jgi:uncharacterized protein YbjT (DUF2867 family)
MKILFIGASGMLGKPVAKELINAGYDVTLLARDVDKMKQMFPEVKIMYGDVFNSESLKKAFSGQDIVYMNLSVNHSSKEKDQQPEREGIDNIIEAAKESGIKRLACISSLVHFYEGMNGFSWWSFRVKDSAIKKIKNSGIAYTIFYPSTFMETLPYQMMRGSKIALLGKSTVPMWFIGADDYAKQVSRSFEISGNENKEYNIQGPEAFTFDEAAKVFIDNYKKSKLSTMKAPVSLMKFFGIFSQKLNYTWHICEALNKYPEKFDSQLTWNELGKPTTRLADYAKSL